MLVPGAYLLFFRQDDSNQVVNVYPGDGPEQGLRGDQRYNPTYDYTEFTVRSLDATGKFRLEYHQGGSLKYVRYREEAWDLIGTADKAEATHFAAREGRDSSGSYHILTFDADGKSRVVENITDQGVRSEIDTGSNGTKFEFVQVPRDGNYTIVKVEATHLDHPSPGKATCSLSANRKVWFDTSSSPPKEIDWIHGDDIYTEKGKQCVLIMELVGNSTASDPAFYNIEIGPEGGPLESPNPTVIPGAPFAVTKNGGSTRMTLTELSLESGKMWQYQLSVEVGGRIYTCDPKIYNDGTNPPPPLRSTILSAAMAFLDSAISILNKLRSALRG